MSASLLTSLLCALSDADFSIAKKVSDDLNYLIKNLPMDSKGMNAEDIEDSNTEKDSSLGATSRARTAATSEGEDPTTPRTVPRRAAMSSGMAPRVGKDSTAATSAGKDSLAATSSGTAHTSSGTAPRRAAASAGEPRSAKKCAALQGFGGVCTDEDYVR